jgi:hypothetical protein
MLARVGLSSPQLPKSTVKCGTSLAVEGARVTVYFQVEKPAPCVLSTVTV